MSIKNTMVKIAEKITGRKCCRCAHNRGGRCCHPNGKTFMRCWQSITRPGFEHSPSVELYNTAREVVTNLAPGDMTPEEKHQLQKIVTSLQEASETAKDAGLLGEFYKKADEWQEIMDSASGEK